MAQSEPDPDDAAAQAVRELEAEVALKAMLTSGGIDVALERWIASRGGQDDQGGPGLARWYGPDWTKERWRYDPEQSPRFLGDLRTALLLGSAPLVCLSYHLPKVMGVSSSGPPDWGFISLGLAVSAGAAAILWCTPKAMRAVRWGLWVAAVGGSLTAVAQLSG